MSQRHLHELLKEDQEPFHLNNYIADRRCQIKRPKSTLQLKKIKPIIQTSSCSKLGMCKHACFFSFHDSPDLRKSPLPSPAKSPCKSPNTVFLHIPSRTAAMLLEAAARIQKQSSAKPKAQIKNMNFGLFGSILKKLRDKNRLKKREIGVGEVRVSEGKFLRECEKVKENPSSVDDKISLEMGFSCSCSHSRLSSAGWSEEKDMETSSCSSPSSPFRFSLQRSPSTGRRTPEFLSPARSIKKEEHNYEVESLEKVELEEEEDKEQCSPVSVLDPPFEDDENIHEDGAEEDDDYDLECSYAIVQKVKQQLLHKLRRFERLAELDPIELEKRMLEEKDDEDDHEDLMDQETEFANEESLSSYDQQNAELVKEVFGKTTFHHLRKIPADMNTLVLDLISEEKKNGVDDSEVVVKRVCKKLDSWKEVEPNTIDMMIELDFRREVDGWKRNDQEQTRETAMEIEFGIFGLLMEELSEELVSLAGL